MKEPRCAVCRVKIQWIPIYPGLLLLLRLFFFFRQNSRVPQHNALSYSKDLLKNTRGIIFFCIYFKSSLLSLFFHISLANLSCIENDEQTTIYLKPLKKQYIKKKKGKREKHFPRVTKNTLRFNDCIVYIYKTFLNALLAKDHTRT